MKMNDKSRQATLAALFAFLVAAYVCWPTKPTATAQPTKEEQLANTHKRVKFAVQFEPEFVKTSKN